MTYDRAASVLVSFDTVTARDGLVSAKGTAVSGSNSSVPAGPFSSAAGLRLWDPAGSVPQTSIDATAMFPFSDGYGMFAGGCGGADPTNTTNDIDDYYDTNPGAYVNPEPGLAAPPITLRMPSTNLKVLRNGAPIPIVQPVHIVFTSKTPGCTEKFELNAATDANGWVNTPALPFGDYQVCVDNTPAPPAPDRPAEEDDHGEHPEPEAGRHPAGAGDRPGHGPEPRRDLRDRVRLQLARAHVSHTSPPPALPARRHAARAARRDDDRPDDRARGVRGHRYLREADERDRRARQRDAARPPRDGHHHAPAALAGLLQPDRARA